MNSEYELKRLQDLPSTDRLPPGRYVLHRGSRSVRATIELFTNVDRSALADGIRGILHPRPVQPPDPRSRAGIENEGAP